MRQLSLFAIGPICGITAGLLFWYFRVPILAAPPAWVGGFVAGLLAAYAGRLIAAPTLDSEVYAALAVFALAGFLAGGAAATLLAPDHHGPLKLAILCVGVGALGCLAASLRLIFTIDGPLGIESEWGALGQGMGGWTITPAAALLLCAAGLFTLAAVMPLMLPAPKPETGVTQENSRPTILLLPAMSERTPVCMAPQANAACPPPICPPPICPPPICPTPICPATQCPSSTSGRTRSTIVHSGSQCRGSMGALPQQDLAHGSAAH